MSGLFGDENLYVSVLEGISWWDLVANQYAKCLSDGGDSEFFSLDSMTGRLLFEYAPDLGGPWMRTEIMSIKLVFRLSLMMKLLSKIFLFALSTSFSRGC